MRGHQVDAAHGALRRGHYTTTQVYGRFVSLLKLDMVVIEDEDSTQAIMQIPLDHLKERLMLVGAKVRLLAGGRRGKHLEIQLDPKASVVEAGEG